MICIFCFCVLPHHRSSVYLIAKHCPQRISKINTLSCQVNTSRHELSRVRKWTNSLFESFELDALTSLVHIPRNFYVCYNNNNKQKKIFLLMKILNLSILVPQYIASSRYWVLSNYPGLVTVFIFYPCQYPVFLLRDMMMRILHHKSLGLGGRAGGEALQVRCGETLQVWWSTAGAVREGQVCWSTAGQVWWSTAGVVRHCRSSERQDRCGEALQVWWSTAGVVRDRAAVLKHCRCGERQGRCVEALEGRCCWDRPGGWGVWASAFLAVATISCSSYRWLQHPRFII